MSRDFKILIVEDEKDFAEWLIKIINTIGTNIDVTLVESRNEAFDVLSNQDLFFDFVSLDLTLPVDDGGFDKSPDHGLAVLAECRRLNPGTPVLILTGSSTVKMLSDFLAASHNIDVWAEGQKRPTVDHLPKDEIDDFIERVAPIYKAVASLSDVELVFPREIDLPIKHDRLLRIFTKNRGGVRAEVTANDTGLSDTKVYFVTVYGESGNLLYRSVAKCGIISDIREDSDNYDKMISRLPPEVTPRKLMVLEFGAKDVSGVFYGLAHEYEYSFFKAAHNALLTQELFSYIRVMTKQWADACVEQRSTVAQVRRTLVSDEVAEKLIDEYGLVWAKEFEGQQLQSKRACIHGDLHGENILVDVNADRATLIDYGDVSTGACVIDSVTLECSFLFHPDGLHSHDWPTIEQAKEWADLDKYVEGSPVEDAIRFCRRWSNEEKTGNRELAAGLYAYALRQLKFPDTNKELALGLIDAAKGIYSDS